MERRQQISDNVLNFVSNSASQASGRASPFRRPSPFSGLAKHTLKNTYTTGNVHHDAFQSTPTNNKPNNDEVLSKTVNLKSLDYYNSNFKNDHEFEGLNRSEDIQEQKMFSGMSNLRTGPKHQLEKEVERLLESVNAQQQTETTRFKLLKEQVQKLSEAISSERMSLEVLAQANYKEMKVLDSSLSLNLNVLSQGRKDLESKLERLVLKSLYEVKKRVSTDSNTPLTNSDRCLGGLMEVSRTIESLSAQRIERGKEAAAVLQTSVQRVSDEIQNESIMRQHSEDSLMKMLEDVCMRVTNDIEHERKERQRTHELMINLLEETCSRVETLFGA